MKKILLTALIPAILATVLFTCRKQNEQNEKQEATIADETAVAVHLTPVKESHHSRPIISSGLVSTETESKLSFKIGGIVSKIFVDEGESVTKGQLLASLDQTEIDAQVSQARNNVEKTKRDLERGLRLFNDSAATLEQMQNLQTAYDVANENLKIASFNKQFSSIHATTSGKVIRKFVNAGEQVSSGAPVFIINSAAQNEWIVKIGVPDVDWVRIKKGDRADISFDAYPDTTFEGEVSMVSEGADGVNGLYPVEVKIKPNGRKLASGLFAKVSIVPSEKQSMLSIPIEAVIEGYGKNAFVFVANADHKTVKKLPITVAFFNGDSAFVSKGLENVSEVITAGSAFLTEFSTIQVTQR